MRANSMNENVDVSKPRKALLGEEDHLAALPVCMSASPRARARLLEAMDAGESSFIIAATGGSISVRAELFRCSDAEIDYGSLSVDWGRATVASHMGRVTLSRTELRLLALLVEGQGAIVDNERLFKNTWPAPADERLGMQLLNVYVSSLRHRLAAIGAASRLRAVSKCGYLFTP